MAEISLVVNAHREGSGAHPTIRSLIAMLAQATASGLSVEVVVVFDRSDDATRFQIGALRRYVDPSLLVVVEVDEGDLGAARMHGVAASSSEHIAWCDADDLYSASWLTSAVTALREAKRDVVVHPAWLFSFGQRCDRIEILPRGRILILASCPLLIRGRQWQRRREPFLKHIPLRVTP